MKKIKYIRSFGAIGACIGTISAEFLVMFYQVINVRKELDLKKMMKLLFKYLIKGLIMFVYIIVIGLIVNKVYLKLIIQVGGAIILYFLMCKDYILYDFLGKKKRECYLIQFSLFCFLYFLVINKLIPDKRTINARNANFTQSICIQKSPP